MSSFECSICLGVLKNPFECPNCHNNFCFEHINKLTCCPLCNMKNLPQDYRKNISLERIINDYEFYCINGCGLKCKGPIEFEKHLRQCDFTYIKCLLCPYQGNEETFWAHLLGNHKKQIINQFGAITKSSQILINKGSSMFQSDRQSIFPPPTKTVLKNQSIRQTMYDKLQIPNLKENYSIPLINSDNANLVRSSCEPVNPANFGMNIKSNSDKGLVYSEKNNYGFSQSIYETNVYENINPLNDNMNNFAQNNIPTGNNNMPSNMNNQNMMIQI